MIPKDRLKHKKVSQTIVKPTITEELKSSAEALSASKITSLIVRTTVAASNWVEPFKNKDVVQLKNRFSASNQKPISESVLSQKTANLTKKTFKKGYNLHRNPEIVQISNLLDNTCYNNNYHYYNKRSVGD